MSPLFLLFLLGFSLVEIYSRPVQTDQNNEGEEAIEYESDNGSPAEDNLEASRFGDEDPTGQEEPNIEQNRRWLDLHRNNLLQKNTAEDSGTRPNDTPDFKTTKTRDVRNNEANELMNTNDELLSYDKRRQYSKYIENTDTNDQLEAAQHLMNHDVNNYKNNRMHTNIMLDTPLNKRTIDSKTASTEEGDLLFGNNRDQISNIDKNYYSNSDSSDLSQQPLYTKSKNEIHVDNKVMLDDNSNDYLNFNRDRRETKQSSQDPESASNAKTSNDGLVKNNNENEEMAIKRHIKKMTGVELEQLLNSLSEEKRALLKKIIDDVDVPEKSYDTINKREITKKAGAVEDDNFMESGQSESSKVQSDISAIEITTAFPVQNLEATETNKQPENQPDMTQNAQKSSQDTLSPSSTAELAGISDNRPEKIENSFASNTEFNENQAEVVKNEQELSKIENKREATLEHEDATSNEEESKILENEYTKESNNNEAYYNPKEDDSSHFLDDIEQSSSNDNSKINKREIDKQSELDAKLKSLEESFPNPEAYDDPAPYSGPLIRVKRKGTEQSMKKRSAAILPDAKVGYVPYKAESDDDDTDEGNEFDDDGFYDPTPNFVSNENKNADMNSQQLVKNEGNCKLNIEQSKAPINDANSGTMSLGSDTDNVLSGVEGVDENLMFSSGTRNRRKTEEIEDNTNENNIAQSAQVKNDEKITNTNNNLNIPNYQENDFFGGFPRNYEGDLGRYKRIRRVKQSHISEDSTT